MINMTGEIGKSIPRTDACGKVTGKTCYAVDFYRDKMLWAGVRRANVARGRLKSVRIETHLKLRV